MSWPEMPLDQLGTVARGKSRFRPRDAAHLYGGPYPFIQTGDVKHAGLYLSDFDQTYSEAGLAQSKLWPEGTLCITIAANIADTSILKIEACFPDSIIGFIPDPEKADARFIKYLFDARFKRQYQTFTQGAAQENLSQGKLLSLDFPAPDLLEQRRIADILSAYDDLIENNRRRIALLEESARQLYKEWFVRFRFPGHEHVKIIDGVPEGWERKFLGEIAHVVMGQSPQSQFYNDSGIGLPFHQGVTNYGFRFVSHQTYSSAVTKLAEANDILVSVRAPVGRINITLDRIVLGRGLSAICSKSGHQSFLLYALKEHFYAEDIIGTGAIYAATNKKELEAQQILIPVGPLVTAFEDASLPIDRQITNLTKSVEYLTKARDLLLPKLMSGAIPV